LDNLEFKIISIDENEKEGYVSVNTLVQFSGNKYESIRDLIVRHKEDIESLGCPLPLDKRGYADLKSASFNEQQASFILTIMKNTEEVLLFKKTLIQEFYRYRLYVKQMTAELEALRKKQEMTILYKTKTIEDLSLVSAKEYKKILKGNSVYISAAGLAKNQNFNSKEFKEFMKTLGLVSKEPKLQYYWKVTKSGEESDLVISDDQGTPYYRTDCMYLYLEHLEREEADE
jgi:phage regulator Rha-like protein